MRTIKSSIASLNKYFGQRDKVVVVYGCDKSRLELKLNLVV